MAEPDRTHQPSPDSPEALLEKYLAGDDAAFARLVARYESRLYAYVARMTGDAVSAAEVFQQTFVTVAQTAASFDWRTVSFSTWLYRIARNAAAAELRVGDSSPGTGDSAESGTDTRVRAALRRLPDDEREAFLLKEEGDLSFEEIGVLLGCGRERARSRFHSAVGTLKNLTGLDGRAASHD